MSGHDDGSTADGAVRVYVPATLRDLLAARDTGEVVAERAHAVTDALRAALPDADAEELAWAALTTAAQASLELAGPDAASPEGAPARRVVLVLDARGVVPSHDPADPTAVRLEHRGSWRRGAAIHADLPEAGELVAAARAAHAAGDDARAEQLAQACLDHELGWFGLQELDTLLG